MTQAIILSLPLLYAGLQFAALRRMQDGWRRAAMVPALMVAGALAILILGLLARSALPALALTAGLPLATLYLLILFPLHLLLARR